MHSVARVESKGRIDVQLKGPDIGSRFKIDGEWLTAEEAAAYLKIKTRTLLHWVRQRKVRGYPLSGIKRKVWRFRRADLDSMLLAQGEGVLCFPAPSVLEVKGAD